MWLSKVSSTTLHQDFNAAACEEIQIQRAVEDDAQLPAEIQFPPLPLPPRLRPLSCQSLGQPLARVPSPPPMQFMFVSSSSHSREKNGNANSDLCTPCERPQYRLHHNGPLVQQPANTAALACVLLNQAGSYAAASMTRRKKTKRDRRGDQCSRAATAKRSKKRYSDGTTPDKLAISKDINFTYDTPKRIKSNERQQQPPQSHLVHSPNGCLSPENGIAALIGNMAKPSRGHLPPPPPLIHTSLSHLFSTHECNRQSLASPPLRSTPPLLLEECDQSSNVAVISCEANVEPSSTVSHSLESHNESDSSLALPSEAEKSIPIPPDDDQGTPSDSPNPPYDGGVDSKGQVPYQDHSITAVNGEDQTESCSYDDSIVSVPFKDSPCDSGIADCSCLTTVGADSEWDQTAPPDSVSAAVTLDCSTDEEEDEGCTPCGGVVDTGTQCWGVCNPLWGVVDLSGSNHDIYHEKENGGSLSSVLEHTRKIIDFDCEVTWFVT